MANLKISELTGDTDPQEDYLLVTAHSGQNQKVELGKAVNSYHSSSTSWDDMRVVPGVWSEPGISDPSTVFLDGLLLYVFNNANEAYFTLQIPHNYKLGSDLRPHFHWTPHSRGTAESGNTVQWKLDYKIANFDGVFTAKKTLTFLDVCDGVNNRNQVIGNQTISGDSIRLSAIILGRIYRGDTDTWASDSPSSNRPALLEFDMHYEIDSFGSHQTFTK